MTIENPIGTIKKAVQAFAEQKAENEFLEKPETRHYDAVFEQFRALKEASPEALETAVKLASNSKEITKNLITEAIKTSINERIPQEVDSALLLSGGIDSTLLLGILNDIGHKNITAYTLGIDNYEHNENSITSELAAKYRINHKNIYVNSNNLLEDNEEMIYSLD